MGRRPVSSGRQIKSHNGQAQQKGPPPCLGCIVKDGESDGKSVCMITTTFALVSSVQNFKVSCHDGFSNKEYSELLTGTMGVAMCGHFIVVKLHEHVPNLLKAPPAALAPLKSWITFHPHVRIFRDTTIIVVLSYVMLLDINLSFLWLAVFPLMAVVFIRALYIKFSTGRSGGKRTPRSSNVVKNSTSKTTEIEIILITTIAALFAMGQLPDHAAEGLAISQFLLYLSLTVASLTRMMKKLPDGASLPGVAPASEMLHKTLLVLLLVLAHTVASEWLGEDVVLLCLPEVIPVLLWFMIHLYHKPGTIKKMKPHRKSLVFLGAMVAPVIACLTISTDEFWLSSAFFVSCGVSGILTYYLVFMLSRWPRQEVAAAGKDGASDFSLKRGKACPVHQLMHTATDEASGMLKLWAYTLLMAAAASLLLRCQISGFWPVWTAITSESAFLC